jgi:hypothetical protein
MSRARRANATAIEPIDVSRVPGPPDAGPHPSVRDLLSYADQIRPQQFPSAVTQHFRFGVDDVIGAVKKVYDGAHFDTKEYLISPLASNNTSGLVRAGMRMIPGAIGHNYSEDHPIGPSFRSQSGCCHEVDSRRSLPKSPGAAEEEQRRGPSVRC